MILHDGITGFSNGKALQPIINQEEFKKACFLISNALKFKIESFDFNPNGKNFYFANIKFNNNTVFILINAYYPIVAFASEIRPFNNTYTYNERLNSEFSNYYNVLSFNELEQPIDYEEQKCLNHEELNQLRYHNPNNLAEVIFNYWD